MSSVDSLLPGSNARGRAPIPLNRINTLVRRKPLLWIAVALNALVIIYVASSTSGIDLQNSLNWYTHASTYSDEFGDGVMSLKERVRCDQLWRDEAIMRPPTAVTEKELPIKPGTNGPAQLIGDANTPEEHECSYQWRFQSGEGAAYSLGNEILKSRLRREFLRDMVSKSKGYYVRDYPL